MSTPNRGTSTQVDTLRHYPRRKTIVASPPRHEYLRPPTKAPYQEETLVSSMVSTGVGSQSQDTPAQAPHALKNFSMSQKEKTLEELVRDQWLCSITDGNIGLGLRSFLDLRSWFRNNDIPACEVCNEAGIKGEKVCPGCGTPWLLPVSKIETVEEIDDDTNGSTQNQPPPPPSMRKRLRTSGAVLIPVLLDLNPLSCRRCLLLMLGGQREGLPD
ncbi:hypothetical protein HYC85_031002 [Camellia sinensis]|uniref:Non-structural maintenance of chromosomes element 1 homolog n=1 Tax=Camellia sinensis TaxID=4442 RepID=A0A7J7FPU6_CAMSI|nr:hypothetical protein HYC85_031002 [Camellia sinensis]